MKKILLFFSSFLFLLWIVSSCEKTQEEQECESKRFYGTVTDKETGRPLSDVTVKLDSKPPVSTVTNPFGFYEIIIQNPRYLSYYIHAMKDGYYSYEEKIETRDDETSFNYDFEMRAKPLSLYIRNVSGGDITSLNFEEDKNVLTFCIVKSGYGKLNWNISYDADWIQSVEPKSGELNNGVDGSDNVKEIITITIDRDKLKNVINIAELTIASNAYKNRTQKLVLRAEKDGFPILEDLGIMVQRNDLGYYSYADAEAVCLMSTVGGWDDWRLPTFSELEGLYMRREEIGGFLATSYWTSTEYYYVGSGYYYTIDFGTATYNGWNTIDKIFRVRAVRSIH